jgi:hypothetical protein
METTELIGCAFLAFALLIATAQMAFAYGRHIEAQAQRAAADRRVQGVLKSVNATRPRSRVVYRKVDPKTVGRKRYLNSRLVGTILSTGEVLA